MIQVNCGSLSTSCDKRVFTFEKCRGVKVSTVSVTSISYFTHTDRPFIPTITRGVLGLHSLISSIRAGSISQRSAIDAGLAKTAQPEIFSHNFILSISVQMLCERSGMNEIVDRMSIVYFRSDCGFHNYPYMVRGRTFLNSFSAKIWRK